MATDKAMANPQKHHISQAPKSHGPTSTTVAVMRNAACRKMKASRCILSHSVHVHYAGDMDAFFSIRHDNEADYSKPPRDGQRGDGNPIGR